MTTDTPTPSIQKMIPEFNSFFVRFLKSRRIADDIADDLIQKTWEVYFTNPSQFQGRSHLRSYLTGILINKLREHLRQSSRTDSWDEMDSSFTERPRFDAAGNWITSPPEPDQKLWRKEFRKALQACLEGLSEKQRQVFEMLTVEGDSSEDVCNALGLSATHLRVALFRAKEKLRLCLGSYSEQT